MFATFLTPITGPGAKKCWIGAGIGAAAFAAGLPTYAVAPMAGYILLLGLVPAILGPALLTGWRGAWTGFVLALIAAEVGLATIVLTGQVLDVESVELVILVCSALGITIIGGIIGSLVVRRRQLADAVVQAEHRLVEFIATLPTPCLVLDLGGRVLVSNQAARTLLHTEAPEEFHIFLRDLVGPAAWPAVCDRLLDRTPGAPLRVTIPGESPRTTEWVFSGLQDGATRRTLAFFWDIGEKVRQEARARDVVAADKQATLGRLLAGAAHEINDPLTVIIGHAELLKACPGLPPEASSFIEVVLHEALRAAQVSRDLVAFAGQRRGAPVTVELGAVVRAAASLRESYARAAGVELTVHTPVAPHVTMDVDQLQRAILNLLLDAEEAVAHAEVKQINLTVGERGGQAILMVNDSGPTPPEERTAGFGLAATVDIVAEYHGSIAVSRGVLGGAQFTVKLPAVIPPEVAAVKAAVTRELGEATHLNILVVDDEPAILSSVGRILERIGHSVRTASSGEEALEIARDEAVDVIISDLRMPEMSGPELHDRLTRLGILPAVDFIVASGDVADPDAVAFLQTTGLPVLVKPFQVSELVETLGRTRPSAIQVERVLERAG